MSKICKRTIEYSLRWDYTNNFRHIKRNSVRFSSTLIKRYFLTLSYGMSILTNLTDMNRGYFLFLYNFYLKYWLLYHTNDDYNIWIWLNIYIILSHILNNTTIHKQTNIYIMDAATTETLCNLPVKPKERLINN